MRADTKGKHGMGRRFAIVIGVAAVGVMALGAQTGAQTQAPTPPGQATPTCNGKPATIVGTDGGENIEGTRGPDVIVGLGGNDINILGRGGSDVICGGRGWDFLWGGPGNDTLLGQADRDALSGGNGNDRCEGGKGKDSDPGSDLMAGGRLVAPVCEVDKSIEKTGYMPAKFH
jgi:Ca2+-binding RTX toxin-like protein